MAFNLFIAYDLMSPGQNYDAVRDAIRSLGAHYQFQFSLFYVHTEYSPDAAFQIVTAEMDGNDRLAVINCSNSIGSVVSDWDHPPIDAINAIWTQQ